jgi:hypothetical protein
VEKKRSKGIAFSSRSSALAVTGAVLVALAVVLGIATLTADDIPRRHGALRRKGSACAWSSASL